MTKQEKAVLEYSGDAENHSVTLNCGNHEFREFISAILGKKQSISRQIQGSFDISQSDVESIHQLIKQRIDQQHQNFLANFQASIQYDDDSSVTLNSIDEFTIYNEIRPLVSERLHLHWTYMIQFEGKLDYEKQDISISFITSGAFFSALRFGRIYGYDDSAIILEISYTTRSWGADIEALLSNQLKSLCEQPSSTLSIFRKHKELVANTLAAVVFFLSLAFQVYIILKQNDIKSESAKNFIQNNDSVISGINYIITSNIETLLPTWLQFGLVMLLTTMICFLFSSSILSFLTRSKPAFLALTKKSLEYKKKKLQKYENNRIKFYFQQFVQVILGLILNYLSTLF